LTLSVTFGDDSFSASGKQDVVLKAFEDFKALTGHDGGETSTQKPAAARRVGPKRSATTTRSSGAATLPAFLAPLKLKSGPKTGAAIVAWSAQHGETSKLTSAEVRDLWKGTKYKLPSTLGNVTRA
jgi:hypothetical protein